MAESPTTPADPREVIDLLRGAQDHADKAFSAPIASALVHQMWHHWQGFSIHGKDTAVALAHEILAQPARQGVAPLRASGTPVQSVEVIAAEVEAHAARAIPKDDLDLIRDLASGLSLKEIAARGPGSKSSVHMHAGRMRQRLGVRSNCQAVHEAMSRGLLKGVPRP